MSSKLCIERYILTKLKWGKKYPENEGRDGQPRKKTNLLLKRAVVELEKPKLG